MENKMIQEFVSPTKNHVFELNNKIKVISNKIDDLAKDIVNSDTLLKLNIEDFKNKLPIIIANGGHDYVEIAGIKWATMNVGAKSITDTGLYFQWGDTQGYTADQVGKDKQFASDWSDYKFGVSPNLKKYTTTGATLDLEDDAAHANMGGSWHMPMPDQIQELLYNTTNTWTSQDGVNGRLFTSKTILSNLSLFLQQVTPWMVQFRVVV